MYLYKVYNIASFDVLQGICTLIFLWFMQKKLIILFLGHRGLDPVYMEWGNPV